MRRLRSVATSTVTNPWIVAGGVFLIALSPAAAETAVTSSAIGAAAYVAALPPGAIGVSPGLAPGESGPLGLGALVGAAIAFGAALRERFKDR